MPKGPKGERRPADAIGNAIMIGRIATGEIEEGSAPETKAANRDRLPFHSYANAGSVAPYA